MTNSSTNIIDRDHNRRNPNDTKNPRKQNCSAARQYSFEESDMSKRYALHKR